MNPIQIMQDRIRAQHPNWGMELAGHTLYLTTNVDARIHFFSQRDRSHNLFYACDVFLFNGRTFHLGLFEGWQFQYVIDEIERRSTEALRNPKNVSEMVASLKAFPGLRWLDIEHEGDTISLSIPNLECTIRYLDGTYVVTVNGVTETFKEWVLVLHHVESFGTVEAKPTTGPEMWTNLNWTWGLSTNDNSKTDKTSAVIHLPDGLQVRVTYQNGTWLVRGVTHTTWASVVSHMMHLDRAGRNLGYWAQKAHNLQIFKSWWA